LAALVVSPTTASSDIYKTLAMVPFQVQNSPSSRQYLVRCKTSARNAPSNIRKVPLPQLQLLQQQQKTRKRIAQFFCAFGDCGYTDYAEYNIDHDYHDHSYIMVGYLNIYSNSSATTPVNSVCIITFIDNTPAVTARGKREEAPEEDAVTVLGSRPIHQRCS
jgi:hypothetical protein